MPIISILDVLPLDVLLVIITEVKNDGSDELCRLRLVSKAMNRMVEPLALASTTTNFSPSREAFPFFREKLSGLASAESPNNRHTRHLKILKLVPVVPYINIGRIPNRDDLSGEDRKHMLDIQNGLLVPAILSLKRVTSVEFNSSDFDPWAAVLGALSQLPALQDLTLECENYDKLNLSLQNFSNLRKLHFSTLNYSDILIEGVKGIIKRSPALQDLHIHCVTGIEDLKLERFFEQPNSLALKKLSICGWSFILSGLSSPFLGSVVHLEIRRLGLNAVDDSFWKGLIQARIHLEHLSVCTMTPAIIEYLKLYTGLKALHLTDASWRPESDKDTIPRFFHEVLPLHRDTLRHLSFTTSGKDYNWAINEERLESVLLCRSLQTLALVVQFPLQEQLDPTGDLSSLISLITERLPDLQQLTLMPTQERRMFRSTTIDEAYPSFISGKMAKKIGMADVAAKSSRTPTYSIIVTYWTTSRTLVFDQASGYFKDPEVAK